MALEWRTFLEASLVCTILFTIATFVFFSYLWIHQPTEVQRRYAFSESAPIVQGQGTRLQFVALGPPNTAFNSIPTILRRFSTKVAEEKGLDFIPEERGELEEEEVDEPLAMVPFIRASTPFSTNPESLSANPEVSSTNAADLIPSVRGKTPADIVGEANAAKAFRTSAHHSVTFDSISTGPKPSKGVLKAKAVPPGLPAPLPFKISKERAGSVPPPSSVQHFVGRRFTRATSVPADTSLTLIRHSSKPSNFWFESVSQEPIASPPDLSSRPDLQVNDIFYHRCPSGPQLWVWKCRAGSSVATWHPVSIGYEREDGKKLHLTPQKERPQWISSDWHARQMREKRGKK